VLPGVPAHNREPLPFQVRVRPGVDVDTDQVAGHHPVDRHLTAAWPTGLRRAANGAVMYLMWDELNRSITAERLESAARRRLARDVTSVRRWNRLARWAADHAATAVVRCEESKFSALNAQHHSV
jgi:hypothetical protein